MDSVDSSVVEQPTFALPRLEEIETYLESADASALAAVEKAARRGEFDSEELRGDLTLWAKHLAESLPAPPLDDRDRRVVRLLLTLGCPDAVGDAWYHRVLGEEHAGHDVHGIVREELEGLGFDEVGVAAFTLNHLSPLEKEGSPTSAGRYLLSLDDRTLKKSILELESVRRSVDAVEFFLEYDGRRVPSLTNSFFKAASTPRALPALCRRLLLRGGQEYVRPVMRVFRKLQDDWQRFRVTHALANVAPDEYRDDAIERAFSLFEDLSWIERESRSDYVKKFLEITSCLVNHLGREALMHILPFLSVPEDHSSFEPCWEKEFYVEAAKLFPEDIANDLLGRVKKAHASPSALEQHETLKRIALNKSVKHLGRSALVASIAAIDAGSLTTRLEGVVQLLEFGGGETYSRIVHKEIERGLRRGGELDTLRFLGLARHMGVKSFLEDILQLLKHKNRNVREEATRTLTPLGDDVLRGAGTILESGSVAHRAGVVQMLLMMRSHEALRLLEEHAEHEENAKVSNAIREGLARSGSIHQSGKRDLERCVDTIRKEVEAFRVKWLDWNVVPPLHFTDGRPLSRITVQYLLNRQSRSREMTPQGGARSLYHLVDRKRSGDFALHLLEAYLESGAGSTDRWALAVAGILGDERLVPLLAKKIGSWVKRRRSKMAECAVKALGLLGNQKSFLHLNYLSLLHRKKSPSVGRAAAKAFESVAADLGISSEELGDRAVPWLGFEAGKPRNLEIAGRRIEVRIGWTFKLKYHDLRSGQPLSALPRRTPLKTRRELKEVAMLLGIAADDQKLRLEKLLVRRHRWPVGRWRELFLDHPLLIPFAGRLIWGAYDEAGSLLSTFRARDDRGLTDADDHDTDLPDGASVGMVHPLELPSSLRQAWLAHRSRHGFSAPFAQLERKVVLVTKAQSKERVYRGLEGVALDGLTFRDRAIRSGWRVDLVRTAGTITRAFPGAGIDAWLALDWPEEPGARKVRLLRAFFVESGSVKPDADPANVPRSDIDSRLIPLGRVPPVVFSEAMADLEVIADTCPGSSD